MRRRGGGIGISGGGPTGWFKGNMKVASSSRGLGITRVAGKPFREGGWEHGFLAMRAHSTDDSRFVCSEDCG